MFAPRTILNSAVPLTLAIVLVGLVVRPWRRNEPLAFATDLTATWKSLIVPVAIGFTVFVLPMYLATVMQGLASIARVDWLSTIVVLLSVLLAPQAVAVARLIVAVSAVVIAARQARRGRVVAPIVLVSIASVSLPGILAALSGGRVRAPWSTEGIGVCLSIASLIVLLVLLARRRVTATATAQLVVLTAVLIAVDQRGIVGDPLGVLIGMSAVGATLFGVLWRVLTDAGYTRGDSAAFPLPSRVLFFWGNAIVTVTSLALVSLTRTSGGNVDPTPFSELGDFLLGTSLVVACGISALLAALGRRDSSDSLRIPRP